MASLSTTAKPPKAPDFLGPALRGLEQGLLAFWPLWLLIAVAALAKLAWQMYKLRRLSKSGIQEIDRMDGFMFEEYLTTLFRRLGYRVELTRRRGDYGADLVITLGGRRTAVQAKRWSKQVGVKAVQEAVASKAVYSCDEALVVANRAFTRQARSLAQANKVELWDRDVLIQRLLSVRGDGRQFALDPTEDLLSPSSPLPGVAPGPTAAVEVIPPLSAAQVTTTGLGGAITPSGATTATCVTCGAAVSEKVRDYCIHHSARFGGRIYCFKHQRAVRTP